MKRFWAKVNKTKGCWEWTASCNIESGYGQIQWKRDGERTVLTAHVASWLINKGPIPRGLCVLHVCDNRKCVRPEHLFLGTLADNNADMKAKDRHARGSRMAHAKLSDTQVLAIRDDKRQLVDIADEYGMCIASISMIRNRKTWRHI